MTIHSIRTTGANHWSSPRRQEHTPGPWQATTNAYGCNFVQRWEAGEPHDLICGGNSHDTLTEANAKLIASAPELLEAAREVAAWYGPFNPTKHPPEINGAWLRLAAAIEKAEGQS